MKPNILYIMSDDHAANSISCYGSILSKVYKTPNTDRLYNEGCRMDDFFSTNSICTPARATVMTGQYGQVSGVKTLSDNWEPCGSPNIAKIFKDGGYQTAMFGKWHLGCEPVGFEEYCYLSNGRDKGGEQGRYINPVFMKKGEGLIEKEGYVTDIITDMATNWIENRDKDKPFFMMCHHKAPHDWWIYADRHKDMFEGVEIPEPDSLFEDRAHRCEVARHTGTTVTPRGFHRSLYEAFSSPDYPVEPLLGMENCTYEEKGRAAYQKYLKDYLRTTAAIDDSVGELLETLENQGILDDTIIIYTSDQGMYLGEHDHQDKRWSYEEGLRSPFLIRYPKEIKAKTNITELMANIDVAPTLLDYAGLEIPSEMQGQSCRKLITGEEKELNDYIYFRYWMHLAHHFNPAHYGVRTKEYKLIFYYAMPLDASGAVDKEMKPGWELYDLEKDPFELKNVYDEPEYAQIKKDMIEKLNEAKIKFKDEDLQYELLRRTHKESQ